MKLIDSCIFTDPLTGFELTLKLIDLDTDTYIKEIILHNFIIPSILSNLTSSGDISVTASELLYTIITEAV